MHLTSRLDSEVKRNHWCICQFAIPNLAVMSAVMILHGHCKPDLRTVRQNECFLSSPVHFDLCTNKEGEYNGAYLYYDMNHLRFIRSGKVVGNHLSTDMRI